MKKSVILTVFAIVLTVVLAATVPVFADGEETTAVEEAGTVTSVTIGEEETGSDSGAASSKALAAAALVAIVAAAGAIGMAIAISKSVSSMARQPEAASKINSAMMLGLVFIETAVIYALIVAILIIFVL